MRVCHEGRGDREDARKRWNGKGVRDLGIVGCYRDKDISSFGVLILTSSTAKWPPSAAKAHTFSSQGCCGMLWLRIHLSSSKWPARAACAHETRPQGSVPWLGRRVGGVSARVSVLLVGQSSLLPLPLPLLLSLLGLKSSRSFSGVDFEWVVVGVAV